jgi:hypothetical protein
MVEPSLEFLGQRLKTIQDEQHSMRHDIRMITIRLDDMVNRMDRIVDRMDSILQIIERMESHFDRLEALISEK